MRVSDQWLKTFVTTDLPAKDIAHTLTMAGLEVDSLEPAAEKFSGVVVAHIDSIAPHPDADRLQVLQVNAGQDTPLQIVTAAKNVYEGMNVPLALIGAELVGGLKIKKSKLRGVLSEGMLCGPSEIGLSDEKDTGIFELPADAPIGKPVEEYLELDDWVYDIDLTPNRSDCLSIQGVARDVSALLNVDLKPQHHDDPAITTDHTYAATIAEPTACARFCTQVICNVDVTKPTPIWMQECLRRADVKSINIIVDTLNFVMLEMGQPMHAYDKDQLAGDLTVRFAKDKVTIHALDEKDYSLNASNLVITDQNKVVGIAGVIGDLKTSVTHHTKNIVLESAYFIPAIIMPTSRDLALHTQAAYRFERGVDPKGQLKALNRAAALILALAGGEAGPVTELVEEANLPQQQVVSLNYDNIEKLLGVNIPKADVQNYLQKLGFICEENANGWQVTVPTFRVDVSQEADLIEEVARIYGYNNIPTATGQLKLAITEPVQSPLQSMKHVLQSHGFHECINYAFISEEQIAWVNHEKAAAELTLVNPISQELSVMRNSLWPGLLQTAEMNQRFGHRTMALYETGLSFKLDAAKSRQQTSHLAALWMGDRVAKQASSDRQVVDFYDMKALAEQLLLSLGIAKAAISYQATGHLAILHPFAAANILVDGHVVGVMGALHPRLQKKLKLKSPAYLLDLDLNALTVNHRPIFKEIPKYPHLTRDLCFVVKEDTNYGDFEQKMLQLGADKAAHGSPADLGSVHLFDEFRGEGVEKGYKSWTFNICLKSCSGTLVDDEINVMIDHMVKGLTEQFDAHLRI